MPETPEQLARREIDRQLAAAGWLVQTRNRMNLHAAPGIALCETDVESGFADYMLFVDAKALGVLEAKAAGIQLGGVSEQSESYARSRTTDFQLWAFPLPFTYESNGDETRFRDLRDPHSRSRNVFAFHRPETLRSWVEQDSTLRAKLGLLPPLHTLGLRECQSESVSGLDDSLAKQHSRSLVQMATGAGKTWMAVTASYRYIKFAEAHRILFLVDRANLGRQAKTEFDLWHSPYTQLRFSDEYIVQCLDGNSVHPRAKVVISTIQRLYATRTGKQLDDDDDERSTYEVAQDTDEPRAVAYNPDLPPEAFDFIIVDECHRSIYNLWKGVLDYFDAFQIGLTATPSPHTLGYFNQNLVATYLHEQAVLDKVNVGYDIYRIRTSPQFRIAVTVDMIATGTDIKPLEKLLEKVARGNRTDVVLSTLASRLIRLDSLLDAKDREKVVNLCGLSPSGLAQPLGASIDPDLQAAEACRDNQLPPYAEPTKDQVRAATAGLKEAAAKPFHDPDLRKLLVELQARAEITVDHLSPDTILAGTGYDEEKARGYIQNFERFLSENRDRLLALQILYNRPRAKRHLTYDLIRELARAMEGSAYHLAPAEVWKCYARLRSDRVKTPEPGDALTNLISLVRFATGQQDELAPFPDLARQRFSNWLTQQEAATGKPFSSDQRAFLRLIAEEIGTNAALEATDLDHGTLKSRGGQPRALALFGKDRLPILLEELNTALSA